MMERTDSVLRVENLQVDFTIRNRSIRVVRGISFRVGVGETTAIVGESGSGKSVTAKAIAGLLPDNARIAGGRILLREQSGGRPEIRTAKGNTKGGAERIGTKRIGTEKIGTGKAGAEKSETEGEIDLGKLTEREMRRQINGKRIAMVFQDPMTALDPLMPVGKQIEESILWHERVSKEEAGKKALRLMRQVGIRDAERRIRQYPHQFSGGMKQRVVIAIALACDPDVLICDEPTTALDVSVQARILDLIGQLQRERSLSVIYITHDLGVVARIADYVNVMYAGRLVETGTAEDIFYRPAHPYTWGLLSALPTMETKRGTLCAIPGNPPSVEDDIIGDPFAPRNPYALKIDRRLEPPMFRISETHAAATWLLHPKAPQVEMPALLRERIGRYRAAEGIPG